jgi:hypothetical protein
MDGNKKSSDFVDRGSIAVSFLLLLKGTLITPAVNTLPFIPAGLRLCRCSVPPVHVMVLKYLAGGK